MSKFQLYDIDIRKIVHQYLYLSYIHDPTTKILHEFSLPFGEAIIDIAVLNQSLVGFEIKSDFDTLARLPVQIGYYNQIFDKIILVTTKKWLSKTIDLLPDWWGIYLLVNNCSLLSNSITEEILYKSNDGIILKRVREPQKNAKINLEYRLQLLWKKELIKILELYCLPSKYRYKTKQDIRGILLDTISAEELKIWINFCIRQRYSNLLNTKKFCF